VARKRNEMTTHDQARIVLKQIHHPCKDCPFARTAIPGWLADKTPAEYCLLAHHDGIIECHTTKLPDDSAVQCAGAAIYRSNVVKHCDEPVLSLPADTDEVFATPMEFVEHHLERKLKKNELTTLTAEALKKFMKERSEAQ